MLNMFERVDPFETVAVYAAGRNDGWFASE
jgi:hypothetical protein